jgi:hypothetical protein
MKLATTALLLTAAALAGPALRAETRVSIGVHFGAPSYRPVPPVVVAPVPPPVVVYAPTSNGPCAPAHGYWKEIVTKTWVPERWVVSRDRWGRHVRTCVPGYYTYHTDRVWVDSRHSPHHPGHFGGPSYGRWGR